jgi:protein-tyrosine phosphatase
MRMILDRIDAALGEGRPVYIHCRDGIGRTGTVVGCYLARHGIASGRTALEKLQDLRQNNETAPLASPETEEQCRLVLSWERGE